MADPENDATDDQVDAPMDGELTDGQRENGPHIGEKRKISSPSHAFKVSKPHRAIANLKAKNSTAGKNGTIIMNDANVSEHDDNISNHAQNIGSHRRDDAYNQSGTTQTGQTTLVPSNRGKQYLNCTRDEIFTYNLSKEPGHKAYPHLDKEGYFIPIKPELTGDALNKHMDNYKQWVVKDDECAKERIHLSINNKSDFTNKEYAKKLDITYDMNGFSLAAGRKLSAAFERLKENGQTQPDPSDTRPHRVYLTEKVEATDWGEAKTLGVRWDDKLNCAYLSAGRSIKAAEKWKPVFKLEHEDSSMMPVAIDINSRDRRNKIKELADKDKGVSFYKGYDKTAGQFQAYAHAGSNLKPLREAGLVADDHRTADTSLPLDYAKTRDWTINKGAAMNVRRTPGLPLTFETHPGTDLTNLLEAGLLANDPKIGRTTKLEPYSEETLNLITRERSRIAGLAS